MTDFEVYSVSHNAFTPAGINFCKSVSVYTLILFQDPICINKKTINEECCILYNKDSICEYTALHGFVSSTITFSVPEEFILSLGIKFDKIYFPDNPGHINYIISLIAREFSEMRMHTKTRLKGLLIELLVCFARRTEPETRRLHDLNLKNKMITLRAEYLENPTNPPDINLIIKRSGMSRTQFYELYSRFFNTSPRKDLIFAKLEKSKSIITDNPTIKMSAVAEYCGFCDVSHFLRTFKQHFGYTPKEYAQKIKTSGVPE